MEVRMEENQVKGMTGEKVRGIENEGEVGGDETGRRGNKEKELKRK